MVAWQQESARAIACGPKGELKLSAVELAAGQMIKLPRLWSSSDAAPDDDPGEQLEELFGRV